MKNIFLSIACVLSFSSLSANAHSFDGYWFNHKYEKKIKIKSYDHYIVAKYLSSPDWVKFYPKGRLHFEDRFGNDIYLINPETLEYRAAHRRTRLTFHKAPAVPRQVHNCIDLRCGPSCPQYNEYSRNGTSEYHGFHKPLSIAGVWSASGIEQEVIIERSLDGIRAKFLGGNSGWTEYDKIRGKFNEYLDRKGNKYILIDEGKLVWLPYNGDSIIQLYR